MNNGEIIASGTAHLLFGAGISPSIIGFSMLCAAVDSTVAAGFAHRKITGELYPEIAKTFGTSAYAVERNIRTAIAKAWESGALKRFYAERGIFSPKRPTNAACIAHFALLVACGGENENKLAVSK